VRPLARLVVRLYPADWRVRYGEELQTLVEDSRPGWASLFDLLRGAMRMRARGLAFAKLAALLAVSGAVAGLAISFLVTPKYVSTCVAQLRRTVIQDNDGPQDQRLSEFVWQMQSEITSRQSLANMINSRELDLYAKERESFPLEDVEDIMRENLKISIAPQNPRRIAAATVVIQFSYRDRRKAQAVVQTMLSHIVETAPTKWDIDQSATGGDRALLERIARLQARVDSLEKHFGVVSHEPALAEPSRARADLFIEVLDPASLPEKPVFPNRASFAAAGSGAGILLALAATIYKRRYTTGAPQQHTS
jgi:uncharacterized protein involved in exopolysaccharide biosynthesis